MPFPWEPVDCSPILLLRWSASSQSSERAQVRSLHRPPQGHQLEGASSFRDCAEQATLPSQPICTGCDLNKKDMLVGVKYCDLWVAIAIVSLLELTDHAQGMAELGKCKKRCSDQNIE